MNIGALIAAACIGALLSLVLKQYRPEYAMLVSVGTGILITVAVLAAVKPVIDEISELSSALNAGSEYIAVLLKALAVCYIAQLASDCCRDAGETAIASKIDFAGKIAVLVISLPMFRSITALITGLITV